MKLLTSGGCAWRGLYLYLDSGAQLARVTIDPDDGTRPRLTLAIPVGTYRACDGLRYPRLVELRLRLPSVAWSSTYRWPRPLWLALYKASQRFWHNMDGRYGWGSEVRRRARQERRAGQ